MVQSWGGLYSEVEESFLSQMSPLTCLVTRPPKLHSKSCLQSPGGGQKQRTCQGEGSDLKKNGHFIQCTAPQGHTGVLTTGELDSESVLE